MKLDDLALSWNAKESLAGKVALVTGASSGIGASIARKLAKRGVHVTVVAHRRERLDELVQELHKEELYEVMAVTADIQNAEEVQHVVNAIINRWGRLDIVVANAGFGYRSTLVDVDLERWEEMYRTNVHGLMLTLRYGLPPMLGQGKGDIIIISSIAGKEVIAGGGPYSATKYGVNALASALRLETLSQGIRVTTIQPGAVATEFSQVAGYSEDEIRAFASNVLPLHPDDVAEVALYALEQPEHVNISELTIMPSRQAQRFK
ncbi:SDR family oxidoreductase [Paenibacillus andongensis]|uniref:SDR family oxidoreductase n=1 Tax=Paenibacillus andongensis TaxID=2975482 RepID=UPI0021BB2B43|nr:SDR family oxidoreductase [Paenibacillus andongensis]